MIKQKYYKFKGLALNKTLDFIENINIEANWGDNVEEYYRVKKKITNLRAKADLYLNWKPNERKR